MCEEGCVMYEIERQNGCREGGGEGMGGGVGRVVEKEG